MKEGQEGGERRDLKASSKGGVVRVLFLGVAVVGLLVVLLPLVLYPFSPRFPGKGVAVALYLAACIERLWAMYFRQGLGRTCSGAGRDWSAVAVGYAYALTLGGAIVEFLLWRQGFVLWISMAGAGLYGLAVALRYWAFQALRHQWHVDVSDTAGPRHLVREGPYRIMRHPLYLGACLEAIGLPLFLSARASLLFGVLVFIPLEITRAYYEERFLRDLFGSAYREYKNEVWGFLPLPFRPVRRR